MQRKVLGDRIGDANKPMRDGDSDGKCREHGGKFVPCPPGVSAGSQLGRRKPGENVEPGTKPRVQVSDFQKQQILELWAEGAPVKSIAATLDVPVSSVTNFLKRANLRTKRRTNASPEKLEQVLQLANDGKLLKEIAAATGLSISAVSKILKRSGNAPRSNRKITDAQIERIVEMGKQNARIRDIAEETGFSESYISHVLIDAGLRRRSRSDDTKTALLRSTPSFPSGRKLHSM